MSDQPSVIIVGAGLSGLSCAVSLHEKGIPFRILEASDGIGGRVRTDSVQGFLLDRGFQVYLSAYSEAGKLLDLDALNLHPFEPGALVFDGRRLHRVMDVFRRPFRILGSAFAPIGSFTDKLKIALLRLRLLKNTTDSPDQSTESFLKQFGFSQRIIESFFRPFYGGIFLENELRTSSRMFEFTFRMFSQGKATLPAQGMEAIPRQLAARLPDQTIQLNSPVTKINGHEVTLASGEILSAQQVVIATEASQTAKLIPDFAADAPRWKSVTNLYFSADRSPLNEAIIALNGSGKGLINNLSVLSDVAPSYAPHGKILLSISVLGIHPNDNLPVLVQEELKNWFGQQVNDWRHLRTDLIREALPEQAPSHPSPGYLRLDGIWICGDHTTTSSIEGAIIAGTKTAAALASACES